MPQLNNISNDNFQKDIFAVFNKYGMGVNEAIELISSAKKHEPIDRKNLKELKGKIQFSDGYDYKEMRRA
ncbi:MAG: type II toxin-antitoxin system VapB family antitoxin [Elusimicrobiota bacterium]|nr:type II toxin-antitoxin system VapB family antitoxin [Elusimicrobiota bacterium]